MLNKRILDALLKCVFFPQKFNADVVTYYFKIISFFQVHQLFKLHQFKIPSHTENLMMHLEMSDTDYSSFAENDHNICVSRIGTVVQYR